MNKNLLICLFALLLEPAFAQSDSLFKASVKEMLSNKANADFNAVSVSLATKSETPVEETPSVISVVTDKDIARWGSRDLADVLRIVQGFEFGIDVQALYGLGFRGIWGHEGKVLLMVDGTPINCFGFGNTNFFGTIPAAMIERLEIIRGPGSSLYGGFAEIAVINVITKEKGIQLQSFVGLIGKDLTYGGNLSVSLKESPDVKVSLQLGTMTTPLSNRAYKDFYGGEFEMSSQSSWRRWHHIALKAQYKKFSATYHRNQLNFMAQDFFGVALPRNVNQVYVNELTNFVETLQLKYNIPFAEKFMLQPSVELARGNPASTAVTPTFYRDSVGRPIFYNTADTWQNLKAMGGRYTAELQMFYKNKKDDLIVGAGYQINTLRTTTAEGAFGIQFSQNPADTALFISRPASFVLFQYIRKVQNFSIIAGSRYEFTTFGNALAPRIGVTWKKNNLHAKVLHGRAFRVPLLWQAYSRQFFTQEALKPEVANTLELEVGYKFSENWKASLNGFWIDIQDPITYIGANNSYQNFGDITSLGFEGEINWRKKDYGGFMNFSYMEPAKHTSTDFVNQERNYFLAMPKFKVNAGFYYQWHKLSFSPTINYIGKRYGQSEFSARNSTLQQVIYQTTAYDPLWLVNVNLMLQKVIQKIDIGIQVHNLFDKPYVAIQPYYGGHAPMPVHDRQVTLNMVYHF